MAGRWRVVAEPEASLDLLVRPAVTLPAVLLADGLIVVEEGCADVSTLPVARSRSNLRSAAVISAGVVGFWLLMRWKRFSKVSAFSFHALLADSYCYLVYVSMCLRAMANSPALLCWLHCQL